MRLDLICHPDTPCRAVKRITASVERSHPDSIEFRYRIEGDMAGLAIPAPARSEFRDELWKHTCLEAFLRPMEGDAYCEFNFSPSTEFAGYGFTGYREGMKGAYCSRAFPKVHQTADSLELTAGLWMGRLSYIDTSGSLRIALTAVIEEADGTKSYWSLAHPPGKPDFHNQDGFVLTLPPPEPA
jgi:hypothetical protein